MAETGNAGDLPASLVVLASEVNSKLEFHKNAYRDYVSINNALHGVICEREKLQQEQNAFLQLVAAKEELTKKNEEQAAEIESLKEKLGASELNHAQEQHGSGFQHNQPGGVQTRSMHKRKSLFQGPSVYSTNEHDYTTQLDDQPPSDKKLMENHDVQTRSAEKQKISSEGPLGTDKLELVEKHNMQELANNPNDGQTSGVLVSKDDDLEAVREQLIKGILEIDNGGRKIGIKEMGELNKKAFQAACHAKLPPEEVGAASDELYSSWQQQLSDLSWNPFKTITVDGNCQEIVDVDDDKLQDLKRAWGEGAHMAVVNRLMEMKEYNCLRDRSMAYELWNYKEGRKATLRECVEYVSNQAKQCTTAKRRKTRRER